MKVRSTPTPCADTAHGEIGLGAALAQTHDNAFKDLDALTGAFDNLGVHTHSVAGIERWRILLDDAFFNGCHQISHRTCTPHKKARLSPASSTLLPQHGWRIISQRPPMCNGNLSEITAISLRP